MMTCNDSFNSFSGYRLPPRVKREIEIEIEREREKGREKERGSGREIEMVPRFTTVCRKRWQFCC